MVRLKPDATDGLETATAHAPARSDTARVGPPTTCSSSAAAFTAWRARTTRRAAACASRWSRRTTSAAAPRSTIRRPRTAGCARCSRDGSGARGSRSASAARSRASRRGCCGRCPSSSAPTGRPSRTGWSLRAAFKLDAWIGRHRNRRRRAGAAPARRRGSSRRPRRCELFAGVRPERLTGGAQWYDYQMVEGDRLTIAFAAAADRAGADLANHARGDRGAQGRRRASAACSCATS